MHREEHNYIYNNKNRDDTINLLDNIFRLEIQRRERGRILQRHVESLLFYKIPTKKKSGQNSGATKDPEKTGMKLTRAAKRKKWFPINVVINQTLLF